MHLRTNTDIAERLGPSALHVARRRDGTIEVTGDIDAATSGTLDRALRWHEQTATDSERDRPLVIDVREVGFVDSSGLRTLVAASLRARSRGTRVVLRNAAREFARLLEITGLSQQFGVTTERRDAGGESPS